MVVEGLLLDNALVFYSPLLEDIAKRLYKGRNSLVFENEGVVLPMQLIVEQLLILFCSKEVLTLQQTISLQGLLRVEVVNTLGHFWSENQSWRTVESFCRAIRRTRHMENRGLIWLIEQIQVLGPPKKDLQL